MSFYDPHKFAEWLTSAYKESKFKSWQEVADAAKTTRSTLSRYAGAKPQTLTGKPSQPEPELAVKLAEVFADSVDKVLILAGHAPLGRSSEDDLSAEILKDLRISLQGGGKGITKKQKQEIIDMAVTIARGVIAKGEDEKSENENHPLQTKVDLDLTGEEQPAYSLSKENKTVKGVKKTARLKI